MAALTIHELIARQQGDLATNAASEKLVVLAPVEVAVQILEDCGLQDVLGNSLCLGCGHRVMFAASSFGDKDRKLSATIHCKELRRDVSACVTRCTSHFIA